MGNRKVTKLRNVARDAKDGIKGVAKKATGQAKPLINGAVASARDALDGLGPLSEGEIVGNLKDPSGEYLLPEPLLDEREHAAIEELTASYEKMLAPSPISKASQALAKKTPSAVHDVASNARGVISELDVYKQCLDQIANGFKVIEEQAARFSVSRKYIISCINRGPQPEKVSSLEEICVLREYDLAQIVGKEGGRHLALAFAEGAATGAPGFAGVPFNLVLSMFLYFRAVQSIAMFYGYDVKNDPSELVIARDVFMSAMTPNSQAESAAPMVGKVMMMAETSVVKQTVKKGWAAMAERGGASLLVVQMRALAHASARKALEKAGKETLEKNMFRSVFEQIGKRLTQKAVGRAVPLVGGVIGAAFDTSQMNTVVHFADIFYRKRFILEKEARIETLLGLDDFDNSIGALDVEE